MQRARMIQAWLLLSLTWHRCAVSEDLEGDCPSCVKEEEEGENALLQHSASADHSAEGAGLWWNRGGGWGYSGYSNGYSNKNYKGYSNKNYKGYSNKPYKAYGYKPDKQKRPNILLIIIDDLGWNQFGYRATKTGNDDVETPNIDALADKGIKMDRFYATPWCAPSRGAIQTGRLDALNPNVDNNVWNWDPDARYETKNGVEKTMPFVGGVQPGTLTLGGRMKELGYATHLNGKWGIGGGAFLNTPMGMGYESFMGWYGDSMESCDGMEPGFAVGGASPLYDNLPGFWRQDSSETFNSPWCEKLRTSGILDATEIFVGCKSFKQELSDVADEMIRRRSRQIIIEHDYHKAPLLLVHCLQLMHLPMQYPRRFAPNISNYTFPKNTDLRAATYGALRYVDWVIGDLISAIKERDQYDNTIVFVTSDNGGAIYAGTVNNNYPLRGGKFNNFDGGQRVNAFFSGGWVADKLKEYRLKPFTSHTVVSINDLPETLLQMVTGKPYPDGGMRNKPGPLSGVPMWWAILKKQQVARDITYSEVMELTVGRRYYDLKKIWFTENNTVNNDGNWTPNFPNNSQFVPDFGYLFVRPCGEEYCYFDLAKDPSEQSNIPLTAAEEQVLKTMVSNNWNDNIIDSSRIKNLSLTNNGFPDQVALWTHYGASGPFLNKKAEFVSVEAQCWCVWIDDGLAVENVTHVIWNLYVGSRCVNSTAAAGIKGALPCTQPLDLTQAPIPYSFQEEMWRVIGFETSDFNSINDAQWNTGPIPTAPLPLLRLDWNLAVIEGLRSMNNRSGFNNWANIEKYPFNLGIHDHCPNFDIFTAPTPYTMVNEWILSAAIFNNPTAGAGPGSSGNVTGCFPVDQNQSVCPTLDNNPPTVDGGLSVPRYDKDNCTQYCVLWNPDL